MLDGYRARRFVTAGKLGEMGIVRGVVYILHSPKITSFVCYACILGESDRCCLVELHSGQD